MVSAPCRETQGLSGCRCILGVVCPYYSRDGVVGGLFESVRMVTPEGIRGKEYKEEEEGEEEDREVIGEHTKERGKIRRFLLRRGKRKRVVVSRMSAQGTARIGILYRKRGYIQSIRVPEGEAVAHTVAELTSVDAVEDWMKGDRKEKGDFNW